MKILLKFILSTQILLNEIFVFKINIVHSAACKYDEYYRTWLHIDENSSAGSSERLCEREY